MSTRVHMCSVERQFEPNLAEKLVILCARLEAIVRGASSLNDNTRCIVEGAYLATTVVKIDGYYHVNDNVLQTAVEECELAFGSNTSTCHTDNTQKLIMLECKFKEAKYSYLSTFAKFLGLLLLLYIGLCITDSAALTLPSTHNVLYKLFNNFTNYTEL